MAILSTIRRPSDLKSLALDQLPQLAAEMRERIISAVSANGGHLASNLGVVELTIALHRVFDFGPYPAGPDRLLFDVGHQSYPHKLLTGRGGTFDTLRKKGSVSGFPNPEESPYDLFAVGHAGTAISTAVGMARGDEAKGRNNHVVALVGDASIVNGLALEGLNNAGTLHRQMLIVLNDNGMSISRPQGAFSEYLERIRVSTTYEEFKRMSEKIVHALPGAVGHRIEAAWDAICAGLKGAIWAGQMFESMGIKYTGPIDGHDLPGLVNFLSEIKHVDRPVVLHVKTIKGHGYAAARSQPTKMHSPAAFTVVGDDVQINKGSGKSWTTAFADAMIDLAKDDPRIVTLSAAMPDGTGLSKFELAYPNRFIDTGICEGHLVAMAAGMAKAGQRPVAAIYSTFIQRAFDQVWQEVVLNKLPVVFAMDRAGYVGDDGAVHHGFCDISFLRPLPDIVLMAPSDEPELRRSLKLALSLDHASGVRYPRDNVPTTPFEKNIDPLLRDGASGEWIVGKSRVLRSGNDVTLIVYGALAENAMAAAEQLAADGVQAEVIDARFAKPLDADMLARVLAAGRPVITIEDHSLQNGFGSAVLEFASSHALSIDRITRLGMPDRLIAHATRAQQLAEVGLDTPGIVRAVRAAVQTSSPSVPSASVVS